MNLRFLSRLLPRAVSDAERELAYLNGATSMVDLELRQLGQPFQFLIQHFETLL